MKQNSCHDEYDKVSSKLPWYVILGEEQGMRVSEKVCLRRIMGPKRGASKRRTMKVYS
jgi:hypothetical protein